MRINIFNFITIQEPEILLSDLILAFAFLFCYFNIGSKTKEIQSHEFLKYWKRFFLFEAISFFIGGLAHGFYNYFGDALHFVGWYASVFGVFFFTWGMIKLTWQSVNKRLVLALSFSIAISIVMSTIFRAFGVIVAYSFFSMFVIIFVNLRTRVISFNKSQSKGILLGTLLFILAAMVHIFKIRLFGIASQIVSHVVIAIGVLFFGRGCLDTIFTLCNKQEGELETIVN